MADVLRLLFELDVDSRAGTAGLLRFRKDIAATIESVRRAVTQPLKSLNTAPLVAATTKAAVSTQELANRQTRATQAAQRLQIGQQRLVASSNQVAAAQQRAATAVQRAANGQTQAAAGAIRAATAYQRATIAANSFAQSQNAVSRAVAAAQSSLRGLGQGLQSVGRTLTVGVTAPLLALGAASLKSAKDIDANVNTLKAFTGSAESAEKRLAELIKTSRETPGLTTRLGLTLDAQLRVAQTTQETIDRVLPAIGRLNAVQKLADPSNFVRNLSQLVSQNFEKQDLKELVGQSPVAGQIIRELFNVDSPTNAAAIREAAQKMGLTTTEAFFTAFADAASRNQALATVTESIETRFDKIVDRVTVALRPLGLAIINAIEPFIEPVSKLIERLGEAFNSLSAPIKTAIIVIAGIAAAAGPVLFVLGGLVTAITGVVSAVGTIAAAVAAVGLPAITAAVAGITILIAEWAVILGVLGLAWQKNFLNIRGLVSDASSAVLEAFNRIKAVFDEATQRILPTLQSITTKVIAVITELWEKYGDDIVRFVGTAFRFITDVTVAFLKTFADFVDLVLKLIDGDWRGAWNAFSRITIRALELLENALTRLPALLAVAFVRLNQIILAQAVKFAVAAQQLAAKFVAAMAKKLIDSASTIRDALLDMLALAVSGLDPTAIAAVFIGRLLAAMRKAASEAPPIPIKVEAQTVGADVDIGAGILREKKKKTPPDAPTDKGADAEARRRIRILEIEADKVRTLTDAQLAREQIAFDERRKSLEDYTGLQIKAAGDVLFAQLAIYKQEREEAKKIRNQSARDLALAEIGQKEFEAQQTFTTRVAQLEANRRKEELEAAKAHRQALLDIQDEGDRKQLELIDSYVERYLISYEEAEKRRLAIEEKARERRKSELEIQLGEAGQNVEEQQRIKDAIAKLEAESATAREEAENRKRRALQATIEAENDYYETLRQITLRAAHLLRDAAEIELSRLVNKFGDRRIFRLRALELERQAHEEEHQERLREIEQEKKDAEKKLEGVRDAEEKLLKLRKYYADLEKAERQRRKEEKEKEEDDEKDARDPFTALRKRFENFRFDIENTNASIADSVTALAEQVNESISAMGDALRQAIIANILYGESIGKALKAALAQQLAAISAEAAIQSLKHAAYAIGSLAFGNTAAAAKHAAAAAAFGALAIAAGLAGRALSKSAGLYDRGRSNTTASSAVGGGEPRNREIQYGGGQPAVESSSRAAQEGSGGLLSRREATDQALVQALNNHTVATLQLNSTISRWETRPEGVVFANGAEQRPDAVGVAFMRHSQASGDLNEYVQKIASGQA